MTTLDQGLSPARLSLVPPISILTGRLRAAFERGRARRQLLDTHRQLHALSDRELADIGLSRHCIDDIELFRR
jgi:uncharacterized protein YjiS (DUF1127 family)